MSRIHVGVGGGREVTVSTSYRSGKSGGPTDPASRRSAVLLLPNSLWGSLPFGSCARNANRPSVQPNPKEPGPLSKAPRCLEIYHRSK
jgi:hypothetical protein